MYFHISYVSLYKIGGISAIKTSKLTLYCTQFALSFSASNALFFSHNVTLLLQNSASSASKIIRRKYKNNFEHLLSKKESEYRATSFLSTAPSIADKGIVQQSVVQFGIELEFVMIRIFVDNGNAVYHYGEGVIVPSLIERSGLGEVYQFVVADGGNRIDERIGGSCFYLDYV